MNKKLKFFSVLSISSASLLAVTIIGSAKGFSFANDAQFASAEYGLEFNSSNSPEFNSGVGVSSIRTSSGNLLQFNYTNCLNEASYHVVMNDKGSIKRDSDEKMLGIQSVLADFEGKLFVKYALKSGSYHVKELTSGSSTQLLSGFEFNYLEFVSEGLTKVKCINLGYSCLENTDNIPDASVPTTVNCNGAVVTGLNTEYAFDDVNYVHVQPIGTNTIESVRLNGLEIEEEDSNLVGGTGFYKIVVGSGDVLDVQTSLDATPDFTVNKYKIDSATGSISSIGQETIPASQIVAEDYRYKIIAPSVTGLTPNQDYIYVEKDEAKTNGVLNFYYSTLNSTKATAASASLSGAGTESNPYLISSPADWLYMAGHASEDNYYKMTKSISLTGSSLSQVGRTGQQKIYEATEISASDTNIFFNGHLDGNNCSVRGITGTLVANSYTSALFGLTGPEASIKNLSTYGSISNSKNHGKAAGFVAYATGGTFENLNSYVDVTHSNGANATNGAISGIISSAMTKNNAINIVNCTNYGVISRKTCTKSSETENAARSGFGGIVGLAVNKFNSLNLLGCVNHGEIIATGGVDGNSNQAYSKQVGGLIGYSQWTLKCSITNCLNFGDVTGGYCVGGCIGNSSAVDINGFINYGNISCVASNFAYSTTNYSTSGEYGSGVLGFVSNVDSNTISNVKNYGHVETSSGFSGGVIGDVKSTSSTLTLTNVLNFGDTYKTSTGDHFGGIIGRTCTKIIADGLMNYGPVDCLSSKYIGGLIGKIEASNCELENCVNGGCISTHGVATGGIVGYVSDNAAYTLTVTNCVNNGMIKATENHCGGILGQMLNPLLNVSGCINNGQIIGVDYVGGIAGQMKNSNSTLKNCTNTASISGNTRIGGIAGLLVYKEANVSGNTNTGFISGNSYVDDLYGESTIKE